MVNSTPPSSCAMAVATETVFRSHVLTIDGFTKTLASLAVGETIQSDRFRVGGHSWYIECCPRWVDEDGDEWVSVFLWLDLNHHGGSCNEDEVTASAHFTMLDRAGGEIDSQGFKHVSHTFSTTARQWGFDDFIQTKALESLLLIRDDDCCRIRCNVSVIKAPPPPPPSDLGDLLLASKVGRDVTFVVHGVAFTAHSCVLAARTSTAFMAEVLAGKESSAGAGGGGSHHVMIDNVGPCVFRALLHFVYTGSLPDVGDYKYNQDPDVDVTIARGLLKVAHRYDMERLKMVCTDVLCSKINQTTALLTLEMSKRLGCLKLNQACVEYIRNTLNYCDLENPNRWGQPGGDKLT